ncbi:hypothetical protein K438DRAFT_1986736 [Mycena galopus ATCC 62051]|nr:hypothetical protein K438DRAFT_1986736 [Mycena galopus ATCC 62051]
MFSLNKISILVAVLFAAAKVNAQDFAAFTGTACDGIITSQTDVSVTMYEGVDCTGQDFPFGGESHGACIDVQTGTSVKSFRCVHV